MALARTYAMALAGVRGHVVEVEADIENGLVALLLVGLPDTALREARDRIRSAIINSHHTWPQRRITVGLSPASLPKRGSGFDAAIAVAILSARRLGAQGSAGRHGVPGRARLRRQAPAGPWCPALHRRGCGRRVRAGCRAHRERNRGGPGTGYAGRRRAAPRRRDRLAARRPGDRSGSAGPGCRLRRWTDA